MKKNSIIYIGIGLAILFAMNRLTRCGGSPKIGGKILVTKVTKVEEEKPGEWEEADIEFTDNVPMDSMSINPDVASLQKERDYYIGRYRFYKDAANELLQNVQERDAKIMAALECDERSRLQSSQIEDMWKQYRRDSAMIAGLSKQWEDASKPRDYSGEVKGDLYKTKWKAKVFGKLPADGLLLKTDVTSVTTTIEKPVEVWRKNTVDIFGGFDTRTDYLFGLGYERRLVKFFGLYGQAEYYPNQKDVIIKGGGRIHF